MGKSKKDKKEVVVVEPEVMIGSPAKVIAHAIAINAPVEQMERLLVMRREHEKDEARKAFHVAMAEFKAEAPKVTKDKLNKQYGSKYTSLSNLVNTINPILSQHGLSASWDIDQQNGTILVICKITHSSGHSETASMSAPKDESGAKNKIQQIKSTITYLKGVTFESITGLASIDSNVDDDGNTAGTQEECIDEAQLHGLEVLIADTKSNREKFCKAFGIEEVARMAKTKYNQAVLALNAKKSGKTNTK